MAGTGTCLSSLLGAAEAMAGSRKQPHQPSFLTAELPRAAAEDRGEEQLKVAGGSS